MKALFNVAALTVFFACLSIAAGFLVHAIVVLVLLGWRLL